MKIAAEASAWLPQFAFSPPTETPKPSSGEAFWSADPERWLRRFECDVSKRVRDQVRDAYLANRRIAGSQAYMESLRKRYRVVIDR